MKFGIILPNFGPNCSTAGVLEIASQAEARNFDSVWTTDHILLPEPDSVRFGQLFESVSTLCVLASFTQRIRLGISSLVLPQRDPILVAKQIATLDAFSHGRAMLCVGVGWSAGEYKNLGFNFHDRGQRLDEAIDLLRTLWLSNPDETVSFNGRYHQFQEGVFSPTLVQPGGPPIWVGGHSKAAIRRAANHGDGWHPSSLHLDKYTVLANEYLQMPAPENSTLSARLRLSFDNSDPVAQLTGPPEKVIETLHGYQNAGLQYAVISLPGETTMQQIEAMDQLSENVVTHFKVGK